MSQPTDEVPSDEDDEEATLREMLRAWGATAEQIEQIICRSRVRDGPSDRKFEAEDHDGGGS